MLDTQKELSDWVDTQLKGLPAGVASSDCKVAFASGKLSDGTPSYGVSFQNRSTGHSYGVSPISTQLYKTMTDASSHFANKPQTKPSVK